MFNIFKDTLGLQFANKTREYYVGQTKRILPPNLKIDKWVRYAKPDVLYNLVEHFKRVDIFLVQCGIPYWAICGTLLGATRHQGMIPWDDDVDVGILKSSSHLLNEQIAIQNGLLIVPCDFGVQIFNLDQKEMGPFVDVFFMHLQNGKYVYSEKFSRPEFLHHYKEQIQSWNDIFPNDSIDEYDLFPLKRVPFEHIHVYVPKNNLDIVKKQKGADVMTSMPFSSLFSPHTPLHHVLKKKIPFYLNIGLLLGSNQIEDRGGK